MTARISVFVSHSSQDNDFTRRLVHDLRAAGVDVWFDEQGINEGDIARRINEAFIGRQWLILVMTTAALRSLWVQAEVNAALVRINQGQMTGFLPVLAGALRDEEIPALWSTYHRVDARVDYNAALREILITLGIIKADYIEPGVHIVQPYSADDGSSGDQYPLATALRNAAAGDRIILLPGLYRDELVFDKPVEVLGRGDQQEIIVAPEQSKSILVNSDRVRLSNLTIWIGSPTDPAVLKQSVTVNKRAGVANTVGVAAGTALAGGVLLGALLGKFSPNPGVQVQAQRAILNAKQDWNKATAQLRDAFEGGDARSTILVGQNADVFVESCTLRNSVGHGVIVEGRFHMARGKVVGCRYCAIVGRSSGNVELENVEIEYNVEDGVRIGGTATARVKNCTIMYNRHGVAVNETGSGTFDGNTLSNNERGAWNIAPTCAPNVRQGHFVA